MNRFFESSYLTWEITARENLKFIREAFEHLDYLEENEINTWKHTETSDYYFKQRPVGGERPFPLSNLNIPDTELISALSAYGLRSEEKNVFVEDGDTEAYRQQIHSAGCYSNASYAIFFSLENNIVKYTWFNYEDRISLESDRLAVGNLLHYLGEKYSFVLIDWYDKLVIDLSDKDATIKYLDDTAANNDAFFQSIKDNKE